MLWAAIQYRKKKERYSQYNLIAGILFVPSTVTDRTERHINLHGITCLNTPGLIDSGYRGELKVLLINTDPKETFEVNKGERIAQLVIQKDDKQSPIEARTRVTSSDFFQMFNVPFIYGGGWTEQQDTSAEQVIVLDRATNERLFGGENSTGRQITVNNRIFRITGVMDHWEPVPRFYDVIGGGIQQVSEVFIPLSLTRPMELTSAGSDWGWKAEDIVTFDDWLNSESAWMQYWVELDSSFSKSSYLAYLDAYTTEQKAMGRFGRPLNNSIHTVSEWMQYHEVVRQDVRVLLGLGFLFLIVCLLSSISLLLTKFNGFTGEMSLRRALGASRIQIVLQNLVEVALLGASGGLLGLVLTQFSLKSIEKGIQDAPATLFQLDWTMIGAAISIAVITSLLAGIYPAIRSCVVSPAYQLKSQ